MSTYLRLQTIDLKPEMVSRITAATSRRSIRFVSRTRRPTHGNGREQDHQDRANRGSRPGTNCGFGDQGTRNALGILCLNALGTETFPKSGSWPLGFGASQYARRAMIPVPPGEAILTVMSLTVLIEVALFASIGMF